MKNEFKIGFKFALGAMAARFLIGLVAMIVFLTILSLIK